MTPRRSLPALIAATLLLAACGDTPLPALPLFAGVEAASSYETRQALIQNRIAERYPIGGPEQGLDGYLTSHGFAVERTATAGAPGQPVMGSARLIHGPNFCGFLLSVFWRAVANGRLTVLHVNAGTACK
jgi:hypothetical protein